MYKIFFKEKLRDVEKKTELQALKHEEIMLELESIRARRERLMPICPNCSMQTLSMYQPLQQSTQNSSQQHSQIHSPQIISQSSQQNTPQFNQNSYHQASNIQSSLISNSQQPGSILQPQCHSQQSSNYLNPIAMRTTPLLSVAIPQQNISSSIISPSLISPLQLQQFQTQLSQLQFITIPGKQSVTVECQTSPLNETVKFDYFIKKNHNEYQSQTQQNSIPPQPSIFHQYQHIIETKNPILKINAYSQTLDLRKTTLNREINTDPIDASALPTKSNLTVNVTPKVSIGVLANIVKQTRNQTISVNLYEENAKNTLKSFEDKVNFKLLTFILIILN